MARVFFSVAMCVLIALSASAAPAADGFFTVGQADGRWWLFDPDGEKFFSMGACVTSPAGYYAPDLGYSPYYENIMALYGSEEAWAEATLARLRDWNFNTLGGWSDAGLLGGDMPYTIVLYVSGADWMTGTIPDYYSQGFYDRVADQILNQVTPRAGDPNLVGWFLDNEMRWGPDWRVQRDLFADYFSFPADALGKIRLVDFLRDRYADDVSAFNAAWGMSIASFDDLLSMTQVDPIVLREPEKTDREDFAGVVAEHFFSYCRDALAAADPNHLNLGARFVSWIAPRKVVEAAAPYVDVMSVNHYLLYDIFGAILGLGEDLLSWMHTDDMLKDYFDLAGKPILISEFSMRAMDSGLPNTYPYNWFFLTVQTQSERADWFETVARGSFASGYVVGYHWFSYMDEPPEGRFDGENSNFGIVKQTDEPWPELSQRMKEVNADAYVWPIPDDDTSDDDTVVDDTSDDDSADDSADDDVTDDTSDDDDDVAQSDDSAGDDASDDATGSGDDDSDACGC